MVSIHVPLAEHDAEACGVSTGTIVSIHVPLAEHDVSADVLAGLIDVSIHVPLAEHDMMGRSAKPVVYSFNSRAPRGARRMPCFRR